MAEIIVALDVPSRDDALSLVDELIGLRWVKIGPTLLLREGPSLVRELKAGGLQVFLDLKWHDIPHQVSGAAAAATRLGVDLATVHALGGEAMIRAAVDAANSTRIAAVSVLTSHTPESFGRVLGREGAVDLRPEMDRLVQSAVSAGARAVVSSPWEVPWVREIVPPDTWVVVPGIRLGHGQDDQRRTASPAAAVQAGATHLVVGRPIWRAKNPRSVYDEICQVVS